MLSTKVDPKIHLSVWRKKLFSDTNAELVHSRPGQGDFTLPTHASGVRQMYAGDLCTWTYSPDIQYWPLAHQSSTTAYTLDSAKINAKFDKICENG